MNTAIQPRDGFLGAWDRIVGPGMTVSETALVLLAGTTGFAVAFARLIQVGSTWWLALIGAVAAFDIVGGAVCNATDTTKAWYARSGQGPVQRILFVLPHLAYVALVSWLWRQGDFDRTYFVVAGGLLLGSALVVLATPRKLKRPMAFALYIGSLTTVVLALGVTHGLEWFMPALLLKLLVGYLVPEHVANTQDRT